jgi:hypothetical protein
VRRFNSIPSEARNQPRRGEEGGRGAAVDSSLRSESSFNWPLWSGIVLTIVAFASYFVFFARFPVTRDVPWANWILFAIAIVLLIAGFRRAQRRIAAGALTLLGVGVAVFFVAATMFGTKLRPSPNAPRVGQKAPDFTLLDSTRRPVTLSQAIGASQRGVLLVFYRGYW